MADVKITGIRKPNRFSSHEHITHVGGAGWILTREDAIRRIDTRIDTFYVIDPQNRKRAEVAVVRNDPGKTPYLRTYADGYWNDNLLSLEEI